MDSPLGFNDISIWLALSAIVLIISVELINPVYNKTNIVIDNIRLRRMALTVGILFLITAAVKIYQILLSI